MTTLLAPLLLGIKWLDPQYLSDTYGSAFIWIALLIVFIECGLFFPFLPGDTLLFALGVLIAGSTGTDNNGYTAFGMHNEPAELVGAIIVLTLGAFAGNVVGYEIGRKVGSPLYQRDGRIIKKKYLDNTSAFFERHGNKALVIGRFVPFVRTYVTVVAGVTLMDRRRFVQWSAVGAALWVVSIVLLGYFLGRRVPLDRQEHRLHHRGHPALHRGAAGLRVVQAPSPRPPRRRGTHAARVHRAGQHPRQLADS